MRTIASVGSAIVCLFLVAMHSAHACPKGTVFSAYKGNGMCVYIGQGATRAVQCSVMVNSCPSDTTREQKNSDRNNVYCCPRKIQDKQPQSCVWRGSAPLCDGKCKASEQHKANAETYREALLQSTAKQAGTFGKDCFSGTKALCGHPGGLER